MAIPLPGAAGADYDPAGVRAEIYEIEVNRNSDVEDNVPSSWSQATVYMVNVERMGERIARAPVAIFRSVHDAVDWSRNVARRVVVFLDFENPPTRRYSAGDSPATGLPPWHPGLRR